MIESLLIGLSLYTWHAPHQYDCSPCGLTNNTPGLYVVADDYTLGYVRNSLGRPAWYAGILFRAKGLDFTLGAITGYQNRKSVGVSNSGQPTVIERGATNAVLRPLVAVSYRFNLDEQIKPRVTLLGNGLHFSVEYLWPR